MSLSPIYYATVYAPRSVDPTEATVLTPAASSPHSDPFKVCTSQNVAGFQPYLQVPKGRSGRIDYLTRRTDVGQLTLRMQDQRTTVGGSNFSRWLAGFLGDTKGRYQWNSLKVLVEESTDGGLTKSTFWTGRIVEAKLVGKQWFDVTIQDQGAELAQVEIFVANPHRSITYASRTSLMPIGLYSAYGSAQISAPFKGRVVNPGFFAGLVTLRIDSGAEQNRTDNFATPDVLDLILRQATGQTYPAATAPDFYRIEARNITTGGAVKHFKAFYLYSRSPGSIVPWPLTQDSIRLGEVPLTPLPTDDPFYADPAAYFPTNNDIVEFRVIPSVPPSELFPLFINDVHPVQLWKDILDGNFGYLVRSGEVYPGKVTGDVRRTFPYDSTLFTNLINDFTIGTFRGIITDRWKMFDFIEKALCVEYNLAYRIDDSGLIVPLDFRIPSVISVPTLTNTDLVSDPPVEWAPERDQGADIIKATHYVDTQLDAAVTNPQSAPPGLIRSQDVILEILDATPGDMGDRIISFDATGYRAMSSETMDNISRLEWSRGKLRTVMEGYRLPISRGGIRSKFPFRRTTDVLSCQPGSFRVINIDEVPNPSTNRRGGARLMLALERTENGGRIEILMLDLGENVIAAVPSATTPTQEAGNTKHGIDMAITLNASSEPVVVEFNVTQIGVSRPLDTAAGWVNEGRFVNSGTFNFRNLPGNRRIHVRLRTEPASVTAWRLPSAWVAPTATGYVDTANWTPPNTPTNVQVSGRFIRAGWINGETTYDIIVYFGFSGGTLYPVRTIPPSSTEVKIENLELSTAYEWSVAYIDPYGGESTRVGATFTTTAGATTAPALRGGAIFLGLP